MNRNSVVHLITRSEARLQPNIGFIGRRILAVFTRSAITPPKVNRFGRNLKYTYNFSTSDRFRLHLLLYCKVGQNLISDY